MFLDRGLTGIEREDASRIKMLENRGLNYPGRSVSDIERHRINSLRQVIEMLSCDQSKIINQNY